MRQLTDTSGVFQLLTPIDYAATLFDCVISASTALCDCQKVFEGMEFEIKEEKQS